MAKNRKRMTTDQKYKAIKKRLGIQDKEVAQMFGYSNAMSFANSARREQVITGIVELFELIGEKQEGFFKLDGR